jgi:hypothetical protein
MRTITHTPQGVAVVDMQDATRGTRYNFQPGHYEVQRDEFATDEQPAFRASYDADPLAKVRRR